MKVIAMALKVVMNLIGMKFKSQNVRRKKQDSVQCVVVINNKTTVRVQSHPNIILRRTESEMLEMLDTLLVVPPSGVVYSVTPST